MKLAKSERKDGSLNVCSHKTIFQESNKKLFSI